MHLNLDYIHLEDDNLDSSDTIDSDLRRYDVSMPKAPSLLDHFHYFFSEIELRTDTYLNKFPVESSSDINNKPIFNTLV